MRTTLFGLGTFVVAVASVVALNAQHHGAQHPPRPGTHHALFQHCGSDQDTADAARTHHAQVAAALGLTSDQSATIDRLMAEACASIVKYHDQIVGVLTPEQRAKLHELHSRHGGL